MKKLWIMPLLLLILTSCAQEEKQQHKRIYITYYVLEKDTLFIRKQDSNRKFLKKSDTLYDKMIPDKYTRLDDNKIIYNPPADIFLIKEENKKYKILDSIRDIKELDVDSGNTSSFGPHEYGILKNGDIIVPMTYIEGGAGRICIFRLVDNHFKMIFKSDYFFFKDEWFPPENYKYFEIKKDYIKINYLEDYEDTDYKHAKLYYRDGKYVLEK